MLMDIMESVMLRPSLKLTLLFSMVDTMDTTLDMLDTMDIPMLTGDKSLLSTDSISHRKTTIKQSLFLLP